MKAITIYKAFFLTLGLVVLRPVPAQVTAYTPKDLPPPAKKNTRIVITVAPTLELFRNNEAIVRWTSTNPGGSDEHFGVVYYGTDPRRLTQIAKAHIRLNRNHIYTVFRVRITDLKPSTTYYYTVDSTDADGTRDRLKSPVCKFVSPKIPRVTAP